MGRDGLKAPIAPLYMGNSGTSMRLMCGILAGQSFDSELTGDSSLSRRPMRRVSEPLARLGAMVETSADGSRQSRSEAARILRGATLICRLRAPR